MFENISLPTLLVSYVALLFSLSVHEASHATAAHLLGDETASRQGRMTLNPVAHMDPIGTFLFPLLGMATGIPIIGWAKPVPVNALNFTRKVTLRGGHALVAAAGPGSNVVLALVSFLGLTLGLRLLVPGKEVRWDTFVGAMNGFEDLRSQGVDVSTATGLALMGRMVLVNFGLAVFNMLPIGPLDGGGVLQAFLSDKAARWFYRHQQHMYIALVVLVFMGGMRFLFAPIFKLYIGLLSWAARLLLGF